MGKQLQFHKQFLSQYNYFILYIKKRAICGIFISLISLSLFTASLSIGVEAKSSVNDQSSTFDQVNEPESIINNPAPDWDSFIGDEVISPEVIENRNSIVEANSDQQDEENEPTINIDTEKKVYEPNEIIRYVIQVTSNFQPENKIIEVRVYKGKYYPWYDEYNYNSEKYELLSSEIVNTINGLVSGSFISQETGIYTIYIKDKEYSQRYRGYALKFISVSELAIFGRLPWTGMQNEDIPMYLRVMSIENYSPISAVNITIEYQMTSYRTENLEINTTEVYSGLTDEQGFLYIPLDISSIVKSEYYYDYTNFIITATKGTLQCEQTVYFYSRSYNDYAHEFDFIITTDKPIYMPGEIIKGRVLVFQESFNNATRIPAKNTSFFMKFINPSRIDLFSKYLVTNDQGIATFDIPLDIDADTGDYSLVFIKNTTEFSKIIKVDRYEKPAFQIIIDTPSYAKPGKKFIGRIEAEYYFGQPVINGEVAITIKSSASESRTDILKTITGKTNSKGYFQFSYLLPANYNKDDNSNYYRYYERYITIEAIVTDPAQRSVSSSSQISTNDELYLYGYVTPYLPIPDEPFQVIYWAYDPVLSSISNAELTIIIKAKNSFFMNELFKEKTTTTTQKNGQALLRNRNIVLNHQSYGSESFNISSKEISKFTAFTVVLELKTSDGRSSREEFNMEFQKLKLSIELSSTSVASGDSLSITVSWDSFYNLLLNWNPEVHIFVYDSDFDRIASYEGKIRKNHKFNLKLTNFAPSGNYRIIGYAVQKAFSFYISYGSISKDFIVNDSPFLEITTDKQTYHIGDTITITGKFTGTTNVPIMVELVKRGIIGLFSLNEASFTISIPITTNLVHKFFIFAFAIDTEGRLSEAYSLINIDMNITVITKSDKELYEPGEIASISLEFTDGYGNNLSGTSCISFIDSSIFGVQADPEEEAEHFTEIGYWPLMRTFTSWSTSRSDCFWYYWDIYPIWPCLYEPVYFRNKGDLENEAVLLFDSSSKSPIPTSIPAGKIDIRDNLPESMYWIPEIVGDQIQLSIELPDNIGEWTIRTIFTLNSGKGLLAKYTFHTRLPFFVEMEKPAKALQDDIVQIKGIIYNYKGYPIRANVTIETEKLPVLNRPWQIVYIPSNYLTMVIWNIYATKNGNFNITLLAWTLEKDTSSDGLRKQLYIEPNGVKLDYQYSSLVIGANSFFMPVLQESIHYDASLVISPGFEEIALSSWERLVGYPYGCVEQTMSRMVPTVLVLQYLEKAGKLDAHLQNQLESMVINGLTRLASFQHSDGGWGWWSDDDSRVYMTAYVLYGLQLVNKWFNIEESTIIQKAIDYLISQINYDHWVANNWWPISDIDLTAFILRGILPYHDRFQLEFQMELDNVINWFRNTWSNSNYAAALFLDGLKISNYPLNSALNNFITILLDYLSSSYNVHGDSIYWSDNDGSFYSYSALGGDVETTSIVIKVLTQYDFLSNILIINDGIRWLLEKQQSWGWGNTMDTAAAIQAITTLVTYNSNTINDTINVYVNNNIVKTFQFDSNNPSSIVIKYLDLYNVLEQGQNNITVSRVSEYPQSGISAYFRGFQVLRRLPEITTLSANAQPNNPFIHSLTFTPTSDIVVAGKINVIAKDTNVKGPTSQTIDYLTEKTTIYFEYKAPSETGVYQFDGYEIEYCLMDNNYTTVSPGLVHYKIDSFSVDIDKNAPLVSPQSINTKKFGRISTRKFLITSEQNIEISQSILATVEVEKGTSIIVTVNINNLGDQDRRFLLVECPIPTGTEYDPSTKLSDEITSYKVKGDTIEFFITQLDKLENLEFSYKLTAITIFSSSLPAIKLSSMYDNWTITSNSAIIGSSKIMFEDSGTLIVDHVNPIIGSINHSQKDETLDFRVEATDENGIGTISVFIYDDGWNELILTPQTDGTWSGTFYPLSFSSSHVVSFITVTDYYGNVVFSEELVISIQRPQDILVFLGVTIFGIFAIIGMAVTYFVFVKRKNLSLVEI